MPRWDVYLRLNWWVGSRVRVRIVDPYGKTVFRYRSTYRYDEARVVAEVYAEINRVLSGVAGLDDYVIHRVGLLSRYPLGSR